MTVPHEPPPCQWYLPDLTSGEPDQDLVAVGADLEPSTMLAAYRRGMFPMGVNLPDGSEALGWWSPDPRGSLRPDLVHVSRSLGRSQRRFETSVDCAFDAVVSSCADPGRPHGWITEEFTVAYRRLFALGWAHSVEVWEPEGNGKRRLVGGLFGLQIGGLFAAESKFHHRTDASKVAVVDLCRRLCRDGRGSERVVDVQWSTPHLESLGVVASTRANYLEVLASALALPILPLRTDLDIPI